MLRECLGALQIKEDGTYVDVTFGGGGHSKAILDKLKNGKLIAFDQDPDAWNNEFKDPRFNLIRQNFKYMLNHLRYNQCLPVDGILADLGVSSHQFDDPSRGFSIRFDEKMDMRMSKSGSKTAVTVLNDYSAEALQHVFSAYGELRNARTLARAIVQARRVKTLTTVGEFRELLLKNRVGANANQYMAQAFQALRMEVNEELEVLRQFLQQAKEALVIGGRLVVMSYHSLEDRLVKNFISHGNFEGETQRDLFGNNLNICFRAISRKPILASEEEVKLNPRARSARLRVGERIMEITG